MLNLHQVMGRPWAVTPEIANHVVGVLNKEGFLALRHLAELRLATQETAGPLRRGEARSGKIAIVPVLGIVTLRGDVVNSAETTSTQDVGRVVTALAADASVDAIVLEIDSPGGEVDGVPEAAARIRAARDVKPVVAVSNSSAGSAAYWLFSAASEGLVTPSGGVGSIGVYMLHEDVSQALAAEGVKYTFVYAGKHKVEGNPFEPLSDEARDHFQTEVDRYYGMFTADVAKGRHVAVEDVRKRFGQGRMLGARAAVDAGMADAIGTVEDAVKRAAALAGERRRASASVAEAQGMRFRRARGGF